MPQSSSRTTQASCRRDRGAMLLAILFMMAIMVITALAVAPAMIQQAKRDREEEMIHRGTEYERAIKRYYKKFGRYPASLDQLENTNQIRFLRKRYKDPLTKDGQWRLLRYGDVASLMGGAGGIMPGAGGGLPGQQQNLNNPGLNTSGITTTGSTFGSNTAPSGAQLSPQQQSPFLNNAGTAGTQSQGTLPFVPIGAAAGTSGGLATGSTTGSATDPSSTSGSTSGSTQTSGQNSTSGTTGQSGSNNTIFGNSGVGGQTFGGGAIVGVASKSKEQGIRVFNKKKNYDDWVFIYSPMFDLPNVLLKGPYNGQTMTTSQVGTPAGQLNQQNLNQPGGLQQNQLNPTGTQSTPSQTPTQQ